MDQMQNMNVIKALIQQQQDAVTANIGLNQSIQSPPQVADPIINLLL